MTNGVGGSNVDVELAGMDAPDRMPNGITIAEYHARRDRAQVLMREREVAALYLDTSPNLMYFTGLSLKQSERLHGAVLPAEGPVTYLSPAFEEPKIRSLLLEEAEIRVWEEHEDPTALVISTVEALAGDHGVLAVDPATPFFLADGMRRAGNRFELRNGTDITTACRAVKSEAEIALLQRANDVTLAVHKAAARILRPGISTLEVERFVIEAHRRLGAIPPPGPPLVLFGEATAYPHGTGRPQVLEDGDMVLLDLGAFVGGYRSDMTRSYVFGTPTTRQREVWELERDAQAAAFTAARPGAACEDIDLAARGVIVGAGFGPDYALPGLPHRTGHGIGLEVHEERYIVKGNMTPLVSRMCFSIEPTICIYGEFGIRLEDCAYMTDAGARWFTPPCTDVDDPFGYGRSSGK